MTVGNCDPSDSSSSLTVWSVAFHSGVVGGLFEENRMNADLILLWRIEKDRDIGGE